MLQSSRNSLALVLEDVNNTLNTASPKVIGDGLLGVSGVLAENVNLRKTLVDVAVAPETKQSTLNAVFGTRVDDAALQIVVRAANRRFARAQDFVTAVETAGVTAIAAAAQAEGTLGQVEEEVFRFTRLLVSDHELDGAFESPAPTTAKRELVSTLLASRVSEYTLTLIHYAVSHPRGKRVSETLENFSQVLAFRQQRAVADVTVAHPLTQEQEERLARALSASYGRELVLNVHIDPNVVGGVRVQVGDEVTSSTIADRIADVRRRLAS